MLMRPYSFCSVLLSFIVPVAAIAANPASAGGKVVPQKLSFPRTVDISLDVERRVVVAQGTDAVYQGHPTTVLLPDGHTMYCVWTIDHAGPCGSLKRSDDGGRTWSELLRVPENWTSVRNCPTIWRLTDPRGRARMFVFAGQGPDNKMQRALSNDEGKTWTPMESVGLECVVPFTTIEPIHGGKKLLGLANIRRPNEKVEQLSNVIAQSISDDGGLTWSPWRIILDLPGLKPCEPCVVRSPDGKQLLTLLRENQKREALYITSDDEGRTWSNAKKLPPGLFGDRHVAKYAPDGLRRGGLRGKACKEHQCEGMANDSDKRLHNNNGVKVRQPSVR